MKTKPLVLAAVLVTTVGCGKTSEKPRLVHNSFRTYPPAAGLIVELKDSGGCQRTVDSGCSTTRIFDSGRSEFEFGTIAGPVVYIRMDKTKVDKLRGIFASQSPKKLNQLKGKCDAPVDGVDTELVVHYEAGDVSVPCFKIDGSEPVARAIRSVLSSKVIEECREITKVCWPNRPD